MAVNEIYHLKQHDGTDIDPLELDDLALGAKLSIGIDPASPPYFPFNSVDLLQYFLDEADQTDADDYYWGVARIYYALTESLYNLLNDRKAPFS